MISKLLLIEQVTIQIKKQQLLNKGLNNDIINKLLQSDPTNKDKSDTDKVGSYTDWIVSRYLKDRQFNDFTKLYSQLEQYDKSKHKIPDKQLQNIGQFKTLNDLITFVNNNQDKLNVAPTEFIIEEKKDYCTFYSKQFIIQVPYTTKQSIELGSGTKWCTSQKTNNIFSSYYHKGLLFYITNKTKQQEKYNLYLNFVNDIIEFADAKDKHLTYKLFDMVKQDNTLIPQIKKYFEHLEGTQIYEMKSNMFEDFLQCITVNDIIQWFEKYVDGSDFASIYFITDKQEQIEHLTKSDRYFRYIQNPSLDVQIYQVKNYPFLIHEIEKATKEIQLQQVSQNGDQIRHILNAGIYPHHDTQLQQVSNDGYQITHLIKARIHPIENDVQLQQVSRYGNQIKYIIDAGIKPSEDVQLQQVSRCGNQIKYIENPSEKVQLQQIKQQPDQYYQIEHPTPQQTQLFKRLIRGFTESTGYISKLLDVK